jgi:hypothetical protein
MLIVDIIGQFHAGVTGQKMSSLSLPRRKSGLVTALGWSRARNAPTGTARLTGTTGHRVGGSLNSFPCERLVSCARHRSYDMPGGVTSNLMASI